MTELAESVAMGSMAAELNNQCPYAFKAEGAADLETESHAFDDRESEESDGATLGKNLLSGSPGRAGTVEGPYASPAHGAALRVDTRRTGLKVKVPATAAFAQGVFGFTLAAHHLIPGEASLAKAKQLYPFMLKDSTVSIRGKSKVISQHIGYNVNGAHNGIWLPGNYYIRAGRSPSPGKSWSDLGSDPWCLSYMSAVSAVSYGCFHDTHEQYSDAVRDMLDKIGLSLMDHECSDCKGDKVNPPFMIKARLYAASDFLKRQMQRSPHAWKRTWFTSDRWRPEVFDGGKVSPAFLQMYTDACKLNDL